MRPDDAVVEAANRIWDKRCRAVGIQKLNNNSKLLDGQDEARRDENMLELYHMLTEGH
jgi:hypothetical protein